MKEKKGGNAKERNEAKKRRQGKERGGRQRMK